MLREITENFLKDESATTAIEFGFIAALVSIAALGSLSVLGQTTESIFDLIATGLANSAPVP